MLPGNAGERPVLPGKCRPPSSLRQRVRRVLHHYEDVVLVRGDQHLVLPALDSEVGELVGRVEVADDGLGALGKGGDQNGVLEREKKRCSSCSFIVIYKKNC